MQVSMGTVFRSAYGVYSYKSFMTFAASPSAELYPPPLPNNQRLPLVSVQKEVF
jgi:hypothetical protein